MKKNLVLLILFFKVSSISSQDQTLSIGFTGGVSYATVKAIDYLPGNYSHITGFAASSSIRLLIKTRYFLQTEIGYLQNGYKYDFQNPATLESETLGTSYIGHESKSINHNISNSWMTGYRAHYNRFRVSLGAGVYYSYYLTTTNKTRNYSYFDPSDPLLIRDPNDPAFPLGYSENYHSSSERNESLSNWDFGLSGKLDVGYNLKSNYSLLLVVAYNYGLLDINKSEFLEGSALFNRELVTTIGVEIDL